MRATRIKGAPEAAPGAPPRGPRRRQFGRGALSLIAQGEPMLWMTGLGLSLSVLMIVGLLLLIAYNGIATFWPAPLVQVETVTGQRHLGEVTRDNWYEPQPADIAALPDPAAARAALERVGGLAHRRLLRTGNFDLTGTHFAWVSDFEIAAETRPEWAVIVERLERGRFYGVPVAFVLDGQRLEEPPEQVWARVEESHGPSRERWRQRRGLEHHDIGQLNRRENAARLAARDAELRHGLRSPQAEAARAEFARVKAGVEAEYDRLRAEIARLNDENARYQVVFRTADGQEKQLQLAEAVRAYPANRVRGVERWGIYLSRWWEFLSDEPREANSEGGVLPAILGTVTMTLIMSLAVVPIGVLAALYLREYAKAGPIVSAVRIAVNNLAGVPSIVFGVFGLGFFAYIVGVSVDELFYAAKLPNPTFGTGGLMWASLTLALLTLPVVIVATEEALAAVPSSMREGSYACGASKWQTIERIVMPRALPGIMTGAILAMARGAGEVAPLMLVGAVKLAPEFPVDGLFPFVHMERSFMHLGFHIFDLGFQSQNSEAAKPMVFTTTLLLIALIFLLNVSAIWLRSRLRRRFATSQV